MHISPDQEYLSSILLQELQNPTHQKIVAFHVSHPQETSNSPFEPFTTTPVQYQTNVAHMQETWIQS